MIKAVISNGLVVPRDPLPEDWQEGTEVSVQKLPNGSVAHEAGRSTDAWMDEVEAIAQQGDPQDDQRLDAAIREIQSREKNLARKRLGL